MFALSVHAHPYPQRQDDFDPAWLNRVAERLRTAVKAGVGLGRRRLARLAARVGGEGRDWWRSHAGEAERIEAIRLLQLDLRKRGFTDETATIRLLALVSDTASATLGLRPHSTQIAAAYVLLRGQVVEMDTGVGKSLTAAIAAACAALPGLKVHVVTVNDYLARRDAEGFASFFAALGLDVGVVLEEMQPEEKRAPYGCAVVYGANKVVVFDYLRDRLGFKEGIRPLGMALEALGAVRRARTLLPGLQFAIVDEADSVFIDEARTPLVISAHEADEARTAHYRQAIELARQLDAGRDFEWREAGRQPRLTDAGSERLAGLTELLDGLWRGPRLREEAVLQALVAIWVFRRDIDYIVQDGKAMIVDENTGRVMPDRSWERGLQQLIEIKEGLEPTPIRENIARLSYQLFFRRYLHLAGMTGTCREVAGELGEVYGLGVVRIEPFRPSRRRRRPTRVFAGAEERWQAIVAEVADCHRRGQPVLVGTRSIHATEHVGSLLVAAGIPHQVLNAKENAAEADVVACAGRRGQVTIATNMAGRGTDIKLGEGVVELGGLFVILSEGHDNTRVDRQLAGRCARQGDPGGWQAMVSLDDEVMRIVPAGVRRGLAWMLARRRAGPAAMWCARAVYRMAQMEISRRHRGERRRLLQADYHARQSLSFSGVAE